MSKLILITICLFSCYLPNMVLASQCSHFLKQAKPKDRALQTFLMANLTYPQINDGIYFALVGSMLSGRISYSQIQESVLSPSKDNMERMYTAMTRSHDVHGITRDVPFVKLFELTHSFQTSLPITTISTLIALFPDRPPKGSQPDEIIGEYVNLIQSSDDPRMKRIRGYGEVILKTLREKTLLEKSKSYRSQFKVANTSDPEHIQIRTQMSLELRSLVRDRLEEAFPETKKQVNTFVGSRKLSELIGVNIFDLPPEDM